MAHHEQRVRTGDPRHIPELTRAYLSLPEFVQAPPPGLTQAGAPPAQGAGPGPEREAALSQPPGLCGLQQQGRDPAQ